jgi:hypothetical protein
MSEINLVGVMMCTNPLRRMAPFATKYCSLIQVLNFISQSLTIRKMVLPVLANGNASVILGYIGRALHKIFRFCGQFHLNSGSKNVITSAELRDT